MIEQATGRSPGAAVAADERWRGVHGIGRYASEVLDRLTVPWRPMGLSGNPASPASYWRRPPQDKQLRLLYSPGFNVSRDRRTQVVTLHDLIHLEHGGVARRAYYERLVRPVVRRAGVVLTVSETSRRVITEWLDDDSVDVVNAGIGVSAPFRQTGPRTRSGRPYFMYVGNLRPHKNVSVIIDALGSTPDAELKLLLPRDDRPAALERARAAHVADRVTVLENVDDEELAEYYRNAAATLMPSKSEGFGLPALESVMCGTPVIYWAGCEPVAETARAHGIVVTAADNTEEWAAAMASAVAGEGSDSRVDRSRYDWARVAQLVSATLRERLGDQE